MQENQISQQIVSCAIEVHRTFGGPGLLESIYEEALAWELQEHGLRIETLYANYVQRATSR